MFFSDDPNKKYRQMRDYLNKIEPFFIQTINKIANAANHLYLDGIKLSDILEHQFLIQLYNIVGHGLCYESAALAMMLLKDNPTARLVQGTGEYRRSDFERTDHAWVEFEENNIPYVVDFAWFEDEWCVPRIFHVDAFKSIVYYTCNYRDFWRLNISKELFKLCHNQKTSYVLPWLYFYRSREHEYNLELAVLSERLWCSEDAPDGKKGHFMHYMDSFIADTPGIIPAELKYVAT